MKFAIGTIALLAGAVLSTPVAAQNGGMLKTMATGSYQCALPGDAGGVAFEIVQEEAFTIHAGSTYSTAQGQGTYILRGDKLRFTSGPKKGMTFDRVGTQLRRGKLTCTRISRAD